MKNKLETWRSVGQKVEIADERGKSWFGYIDGYDEIGIALRTAGDSEIKLFPWTSIYMIKRC